MVEKSTTKSKAEKNKEFCATLFSTGPIRHTWLVKEIQWKIQLLSHTTHLWRAPHWTVRMEDISIMTETFIEQNGKNKTNKQNPSFKSWLFPKLWGNKHLFSDSLFLHSLSLILFLCLFSGIQLQLVFPSWKPALRNKVTKLIHTQVHMTIFWPHHFLKSICIPTSPSLRLKEYIYNCGPLDICTTGWGVGFFQAGWVFKSSNDFELWIVLSEMRLLTPIYLACDSSFLLWVFSE